MTKKQAYALMEDGIKMRHHYYEKHEFVFINDEGELETEDGCTHGTEHDEFWRKYQLWEDGWSVYDN